MHAMTSFRLQDYGPIKDVTMVLTPLHCLIGPRIAQLEVVSEAIRLVAKRSGFHVCCLRNPELDVYPTDIPAKITMLHRASEAQQVLLLTQSPLVVNELKGEEVSLITPDADGWVVATRLCDTFDFAARSEMYSMGELWLNFATGDEEPRLLQGVEP